MQQLKMQDPVTQNQRELRHGMISRISERIQALVLMNGRTKEDLKKYTLNIENTAWKKSQGNQVGAVGGVLCCAVLYVPHGRYT